MAYQASDLMADVIALVEQRWVSSEEIWKKGDIIHGIRKAKT